MVRKLVAFALLSLLAATPAQAWWDYGHRTVATIAWSNMTAASRAATRRLIAGSAALQTPACPIRSLEDAAVWPDCVKEKLGDRFSYATTWHYQDVSICGTFELKGTCPGGNCLTVQIERNARLLGDANVPARERLIALAFLVHFLGDLHQPLHMAEHAGDAGGNGVKAAYGVYAYDNTNLHKVWDGLMAERLISEPPPLSQEITPAKRSAWERGGVRDWAKESWERARDVVYAKLPVASLCPATKITDRVMIDQAYVDAARATLRTAVEQGGVRAALLINRALDPTQPKPSRPVER